MRGSNCCHCWGVRWLLLLHLLRLVVVVVVAVAVGSALVCGWLAGWLARVGASRRCLDVAALLPGSLVFCTCTLVILVPFCKRIVVLLAARVAWRCCRAPRCVCCGRPNQKCRACERARRACVAPAPSISCPMCVVWWPLASGGFCVVTPQLPIAELRLHFLLPDRLCVCRSCSRLPPLVPLQRVPGTCSVRHRQALGRSEWAPCVGCTGPGCGTQF